MSKKETIMVDKKQWEEQQLLITVLQHEIEKASGNTYTANGADELIEMLNNED